MTKILNELGIIPRPRLETLVGEASSRTLTMLTAGPGFGKTAVMARVFDSNRTIWHTVTPVDISITAFARSLVEKMRLVVPGLSSDVLLAVEGGRGPDQGAESRRPDALAASLAQDLATSLRRDTVLVVDDVHELTDKGESTRFLAALCRHAPPRMHIVTASRDELPFPTARMGLAGEAAEITDDDLAFAVDEVTELMRRRLGSVDAGLAAEIHKRTGGWPVAAVYAVETVGRGGSIDLDTALRGEPLLRYLAEEVLGRESEETIDALALAAELPWLSPGLIANLSKVEPSMTGMSAPHGAGHIFNDVPDVAHARSVSPLVTNYLRDRKRLPDKRSTALLRSAASWFESEGYLSETLTCHLRSGDREASLATLARRGEEMVARGLARQVLEVLDSLGDVADPGIALLGAEVHQLLGDWEGAMATYRVLVPEEGLIPARIAWRLGFLHYARGDVSTALETFERGDPEDPSTADVAALCAWMASAHWLRGELAGAKEMAQRALEMAQHTEASRSLATAHTVLAMVAALEGDRAGNDMHYLRALEHAERARDVVQTIRIRTNRGSHFLEEGAFDAALAELDIALRLADMTGFELWRGMALANRGQAIAMLGSLEEAISDLSQSRSVFRKIGSNFSSYPLANLGDVYSMRGDDVLARSSYEEAIALSEGQHDLQALVPALSGLARLIARSETDRARELASRAAAEDHVMGRVRALLAMGVVEVASAAHEQARQIAIQATEAARARHDLPGLAEALELQARCAEDDATALGLLDEAREIWEDMHTPVGLGRVDTLVAERRGGSEGEALAAAAAHALSRLGAKGLAATARAVADRIARTNFEGVTVKTLGGFGVAIAGAEVPTAAWQSKVAREILCMLVANRGKPVHREILMDRLWPGEETTKTGNRLSVALSTIRTVLDPDRAEGPDHHVKADRDTVSLVLENVRVDVETFLGTALRGMSLLKVGQRDRGMAMLASAEAMYTGDFLEDHPYDEWAIGLREEAKTVYVNTAAVLAEAATTSGDFDTAARRYLRMLEIDPYNERAHLSLVDSMVRSGRHGTARRLYGIYVGRMGELEIEPEAFPS